MDKKEGQTGKQIALIIVLRIDPAGHGSIPQILSITTKTPINVPVSVMSAEPNAIYFIPPNKNMVIGEGIPCIQMILRTRPNGIIGWEKHLKLAEHQLLTLPN